MLHAKFQDHQTNTLLEKLKTFKGFYRIRRWQPSWSCDLAQGVYIFNFTSIGQSGFRENVFKIMVIYEGVSKSLCTNAITFQ